ncbi:putative ribonuclease H-like domain-containing protein [Tanacetum coccineum]
MLGPGRYSQWRSRFLRYIDTKGNGEYLRKCIFKGPYKLTSVVIEAVAATVNSLEVPQHDEAETVHNMSVENKLYFQAEKEAIFFLLTSFGDEIYSTVDACNTANEMWIAIEMLQQGESLNIQDVKTNMFWEFGKFTSRDRESIESYYSRFYKLMNELTRNNLQVTTMQVNVQFLQQLQPKWSRFVTVVKQSKEIDTISYHTLFDILKQYQNEVNDIRAERIAKSANPLALLAAAQPYSDNYYQAPKPQRSNATSSSTRPSASTRHKGKEIAKPVTPQSESVSEEDSDPEQAQRDKDMQKNLALLAKYFKRLYKPTNNNLRTSSNSRNKTEDTTPRYNNDNQSGQFGNQRTMTVAGARETFPTGKDNSIVSTGSTKVIPAGRTILFLSLPEDHMADFHHLDDARDIWLAVKARFGGLHKGYDRFQKILSQLNQMQAKPDNEDCNMNLGFFDFDGRVAQVMIQEVLLIYPFSNVMENVLHSFVAKSDPQQQITYEDFNQIGKLDLEELDIKWQMAMLSVKINRFEKKGWECTGKQLDSKARYSSFKLKELDKTEEPKALLSVDSMLNWSDHEVEDVALCACQVYGMIAGAEEDATGNATGNATGDVADDVSNDAAEFALMGISSQVQTCPFGCEHLYAELKKEFDNVEAQYKECYIQVQAYKSTLQTLEQQKGWEHSLPPSNNPELVDTHDKSSDSETTDFASCVSSVKSSSSKTNEPLASTPRNRQHRVCGSRNGTISVPAGSRNRPTSVPAGRPFFASWKNTVVRPMTRPTSHYFQHFRRSGYYNQLNMDEGRWGTAENPHKNRDLGIVDSGCSRSMTGNKEKLDDFVKIVGGTVTFGGGDGKITGKGTIRTSKLNFENVYYVEELQNFNLFSVSQICDTKNKVLFTDQECLVLSKEFQLPENSQVVLRIPRRHNLYCFNLSDIQPERDVTCLLAKASLEDQWATLELFTNGATVLAANKGKKQGFLQGQYAVRTNSSSPVTYMDLFGPTSIRSIDHKYYSLVVTDDFSRFTWVFFLGTKDETYGILKDFITFIENQLTKKVKAIRCDNGTEFKNSKLIELCGSKGIRRDYSNARTPQQNGVAERKNRTLIEAARTMLADSMLPTMFWTEAVSTACYVLNRVLLTKPHNKTPYELVSGKVPNISHLKPFGCLVTILNTSDHLGKFEGKADEGFIVGYAAHSKAYRVYNLSSKKIEETLNLRYLEDKPNVQGLGHEWYLTDSLGYTRFKTNQPAGTQDTNIHAGTQADSDSECDEQVIVVPSFPSNSFSGTKVNEASDMVEGSSDYAEELARLQKQAYEANTTAEKHLIQADIATNRNGVPAGKVVPAANVWTRLMLFTRMVSIDQSTPSYNPWLHKPNDPAWIEAMQEEMQQFVNQEVWKLVPLPDGKIAIGTKWILKNKRDARGIVVRNKARLVAQGHRQEEGIDYDRAEFNRVVKALYGLHQPPRPVSVSGVARELPYLVALLVPTGRTIPTGLVKFSLELTFL